MLILLILIALLAAAAFVAALESRELHQQMRPTWRDVEIKPRRSLVTATYAGDLTAHDHLHRAEVMLTLDRHAQRRTHQDLALAAMIVERLRHEARTQARDRRPVRAVRRVQGLA